MQDSAAGRRRSSVRTKGKEGSQLSIDAAPLRSQLRLPLSRLAGGRALAVMLLLPALLLCAAAVLWWRGSSGAAEADAEAQLVACEDRPLRGRVYLASGWLLGDTRGGRGRAPRRAPCLSRAAAAAPPSPPAGTAKAQTQPPGEWARRDASQTKPPHRRPAAPQSYGVIYGLCNQLLSHVNAVTLALAAGLDGVVLPPAWSRPHFNHSVEEDVWNRSTPITTLIDIAEMRRRLEPAGIEVFEVGPRPPRGRALVADRPAPRGSQGRTCPGAGPARPARLAGCGSRGAQRRAPELRRRLATLHAATQQLEPRAGQTRSNRSPPSMRWRSCGSGASTSSRASTPWRCCPGRCGA
jgi:hypothetical protein